MINLEQISFELIMHSGDGRSYAFEAISEAKKGNLDKADELIKKSSECFTKAHNMQTKLLCNEADGNKVQLDLLFVHAQDHLMTGMTVKQIAEEIIDIRKDMLK